MDPYLKQKVLTASPAQLISYVYDLGISSCINRDKIKLNKVKNMRALNPKKYTSLIKKKIYL